MISDERDTRENTYRKLNDIKFLFYSLSDIGQRIFLKSLNKNKIKKFLGRKEKISMNRIHGYYQYENYFVYHFLSNERQLFFIKKSDIDKAIKNLKVLINRDFKTKNKHKLN